MSLIISILTILGVILGVLFVPSITIMGKKLSSYWVIAILGAVLLVLTGSIGVGEIWARLGSNNSINPLKILTLFISMSIFSVFLDKVGFLRYLANSTLQRAKYGQTSLFVSLYLLVSVLTVFTSNDIVILTFTPFICYFTRSAKINPLPYLITEFVAANTWSMALIIGNPTNIYIATANSIDFIEYLKVMALPTIVSGATSFGLLYLIFREDLKVKMTPKPETIEISDRVLLYIGLFHLAACTICLVLSSVLRFEMWIIAFGFALSLFACVLIYSLISRKKAVILSDTLHSAPWETIPFVLSMFILILAQEQSGMLANIALALNCEVPIFSYGLTSFFASNVLNNIPMSILFTSVLDFTTTAHEHLISAYSVIIGSNIGALLSPLGALAGVMWSNILNTQGINFSFLGFVRYGVMISIPTILAALIALHFIIG